jgi:very-short-patch-repair endonuclease
MKGKLGYKIRTIICVSCGKQVTDHMRSNQRYCSLECYRNAPKPQRKRGVERPCAVCNAPVYVTGKRIEQTEVFCGKAHANEWQSKNKTSHICKMCGGTFQWSPSRQKAYNITYCSLECRDADPDRYTRLIEMNAMQQRRFQSSIERIGYAVLDALGVAYDPQFVIGGKFCVDAFIPSHGIVVQFDGDYWHGNPEKFPKPDARQQKRMRLDVSQDAYMVACGYRVLRFWGSDLQHNLDAVTTQLHNALTPQ